MGAKGTCRPLCLRRTAGSTALHLLENLKTLENYYPLYASLGEFYAQAGEKERAVGYFQQAAALTKSAATKEVMDRKIRACIAG